MVETVSFYDDLHYEDGHKPAVKVMLKNDLAKEIRILFRKGQEMKEHKAPYPIIVQVLEGLIDFGVEEKRYLLKKGMMIQLSADIPHDLVALEESMVRLSLNLQDHPSRVENIK
ncbi:cupin domain-containing protein [Chryseobacterium fluminis]|uniref:cupin domain-containing protein n=1 Tax=Chryseobacterium fluminis TaxID=2983606 RepID=UPI00225A0325|nr:cupin domain-containing protein [Chryseobacterium sp. MMS21-Ot14]UZT99329.1 cupin domain-containing protein [Chryseobacterium sp. MMS21-Ot14]